MKVLEKAVRKQYKYHCKRNKKAGRDEVLQSVKNWAEEWIMKRDGKLTLIAMKEVQQILDKLGIEDSQ